MSRDYMIYDTIQSPYIRERLRQTRWEDRGYIHALCELRAFLRTGPGGYAGALGFGSLKQRYPEEHLALLEEIDPERAERERRERAERAEAWARWEAENERQRQIQLTVERDSWLRAGGLE